MCSSMCAHLAAAPSQTSPREQCQPQDTPSAGAHLAEEALASGQSILPRTLPIPVALGCLPIVNTASEHRPRVLGQQNRDWDWSGHHSFGQGGMGERERIRRRPSSKKVDLARPEKRQAPSPNVNGSSPLAKPDQPVRGHQVDQSWKLALGP